MWQTLSYYALLVIESVIGVFGVRLYEEPAYEVLDRLNNGIEIRRYAPRHAAEVLLPEGGEEARGTAFRLLFDYISGANQGRAGSDLIAMTVPVAVREPERVAMTVPVESANSDGLMRMRFFLPAKYDTESAPPPLDARVKLVTIPPQTIAALRYSGSGRDFEARQSELVAALDATHWQPLGAPYTLYYDAPFTLPFLRRNEAALGVTKRP